MKIIFSIFSIFSILFCAITFAQDRVPTFNQIPTTCAGEQLTPLPTTSLEGISGSWYPELNVYGTFVYTFTPNPGQKATTVTMQVTVDLPQPPTFTEIPPICEGGVVPDLPTISLEGITGVWEPALNNMQTTTYTFLPDNGQCASVTTLTITIVPLTIPVFNDVDSICSGGSLNALPTTSIDGIIGQWSPALNNSRTTTYTFTPNPGQCAATTTLTIAVLSPILPTFDAIDPICSEISSNVLPSVSNEGIYGVWTPNFDNTKTTTYTFFPEDGQCAVSTTMKVEVIKSGIPIFELIDPICSGEELTPLPNRSLNGITGVWSPELDNTVTTTYTFMPDVGQCATPANTTIIINPIYPEFDEIKPICEGENLAELPTISNDGIIGTWFPELNNKITTTYTFTPNEGQCASSVNLTIVVNQKIIDFSDLIICPEMNIGDLPTVSSNGVHGMWSKDVEGYFTFYPDQNQCVSKPVNVKISPNISPEFEEIAPIEIGGEFELPAISLNNITGTWLPEINNMKTTTYTFLPSPGQCATGVNITVEVYNSKFSGVSEEQALFGQDNLFGANSTGNSNEVGVTSGVLSVAPSGSAEYNIPILVPPGINGTVPNIALSYTSDAGIGIAGYGWNLSGISSITKIPSTKFHDGISDPVDFDSYDRFALDGQRLLLKSGVYGQANSVYETEQFSNMKITFTGSYFKINYPDGAIAFYGQTSDSQAGVTYGISYWQNPQGARISYNYIKSNNLLYINTIKYGSLTTGNPINEIKFSYKNRSRKEQSYIAGFLFINDKIITSISVKGNNVGLRNYTLSYDSTLGYERLKKITEKNGKSTKSYNPTTFEYENEDLSNNIVRSTVPNFINGITYTGGGIKYHDGVFFQTSSSMTFDQKKLLNGDFDGDGDQDFIYENTLYSKISDNGNTPTMIDFSSSVNSIGTISSRFPIKALQNVAGNFKLLNRDGWCFETKTYNSGVTLINYYLYSKDLITNNISQLYSRQININGNSEMIEGFTGDFNGDGLTDRLILKNYSLDPTHNGELYLVDLDARMSSGYMKNLGIIYDLTSKARFQDGNFNGTHIYIADMNADGKSDIVVFKGGSVNTISVYSLDVSDNLVKLWDTAVNFVHNDKNKTKDRLFYEETYVGSYTPQPPFYPFNVKVYEPHYYDPILADLNGDGNTDIILPGLERKVLMSTGLYLTNESLSTTFPPSKEYNAFIPTDFNGDGKVDIVAMRKLSQNSFSVNSLTRISSGHWSSYSNNFSNSNSSSCGTPTTDLKPFMIKTSKAYSDRPQILVMEYQHYVPCLVNFKIGFYTNKNVNTLNKSLKSITYGNGMREFVYYGQLVPGSNLYSPSGQNENYPNYDINGSCTLRAVDHISKEINSGNFKYQYFRYCGAVANTEGLGFLGFRSVVRTNWFTDFGKIISTVSQADISLRGAVVNTFSVDGLVPANKVLATGEAFINKSTHSYNNNLSVNPLLSNKVYKLRNTFTQQSNGLDNTITSITSTYDTYNINTIKTIVSSNTGSDSRSVEEVYEYDNFPSSTPYMIGRPKSKKVTIKISPDNDTSINEEIYTYSSNLLTETKKRYTNSGIITDYIVEARDYDIYGNIIKKTLSAPNVDNRISSYQYDSQTHRFLTRETDIYGQSINMIYDLSTGLLLSKQFPSIPGFPIKNIYNYDTWGKLTKTTQFLGTSQLISYVNSYTRMSDGVQKLTTVSDGSAKKIITDHLGRTIHEQVKDINDKWSCISTEYDFNNNILKISKPYFVSNGNLGNYSVWNESQYDVYGRLIKSNILKSLSSSGQQSIYSYSGLARTENDGVKQKTTTQNPYGQIKTISELGGETVNYVYYANGNLKKTLTGDSQILIERDGFGRKKRQIDPSAGTYIYGYNNFGELLSEQIFGKGVTKYVRDEYGRIITRTMIGEGTDYTNNTTEYTYNAYNQISQMLYIDEANDYRISYINQFDNYNRLKNKREVRNSSTNSKKYFDFQKEYLYDAFGRPDREHFYAKDVLTNKVADKWIRTVFKNGYKYQLIDMLNNTVNSNTKLWQTNLTDASGNIITADMGNGVKISNIFNSGGFPVYFSHQKGTNYLMSLFTIFNSNHNNLQSRQYIMPNMLLQENLLYDAFDRLVSYKDQKGYVTQNYNSNGTISNNFLGNYEYNLSSKPYTETSFIATNQEMFNYYSNHQQDITYNLFNSPVSITESGLEKVDFEYNPFNQRAVMFYGDSQNAKTSRVMRKFYSSDGTMEIRRRTTKGGTNNDFSFFIGGDAYTAPVLLRYVNTSKNYYYLHRDYQGSIMAISGSEGNVVERRMYDPWGSIIKFSGTTTSLPTNSMAMFLDRGYTGHEHMPGVGLINMNGRIYDPKVHRFLQADTNIQDPLNLQNFNRFSYCMNNPTKYSDKDGEFWGFFAGFLFSTYVHGAQATGQPNPLKWNLGEYFNAFMAPTSTVLSTQVTNFANSYIDNYNSRPQLDNHASSFSEKYPYLKLGEPKFFETYNHEGKDGFFAQAYYDEYQGKYSDIVGGNIEWRTLSGEAWENSGTGKYNTAIDVGIDATVTKISGALRLGSENFNYFRNGHVALFTGGANLSNGWFSGERGLYGVMLDANIGGSVFEGETTEGINIFGVEISKITGVSAEAAHAGFTMGAWYDSNEKKFHIEGIEHFGWGIGEKLGGKITIPCWFCD